MASSILVVDDDPAALSGLVELLKTAGYLATGCRQFEEAVQTMATAQPDLLVVDVRLGAYNGLHLIHRSRRSHPRMASIVISAHPDPIIEREAAQAGAAAFLLKPLNLGKFLATVADTLGQRP
jgi:DNA-binding NtrC family response regulator